VRILRRRREIEEKSKSFYVVVCSDVQIDAQWTANREWKKWKERIFSDFFPSFVEVVISAPITNFVLLLLLLLLLL
jgi:protein involved in sex pheromone biosynthesis